MVRVITNIKANFIPIFLGLTILVAIATNSSVAGQANDEWLAGKINFNDSQIFIYNEDGDIATLSVAILSG